MAEPVKKPLPFQYQFAAGAIAGVTEILCLYPLDVVKTRMQLQMGKGTGEDAYSSMLDCFRKIIAKEGPGRLYRGILPPILVEAPKRAVKFSANEKWGSFWRTQFKSDRMTQGLSVLTGASAGATEAFVVVPFELVKIRLQDKANAGKYSGTMDAVKKIVAAEGPLALYNGLEATLCRHITWNAGYFGCIQGVRSALPPVGIDPTTGKKIKSQEMRNSILAGAVGGFVGTVLNTPFDVVKSRIQNTTRIPGQKAKYNWAIPSVITVGKEEGEKRFSKALHPKFYVYVQEELSYSCVSMPFLTSSVLSSVQNMHSR